MKRFAQQPSHALASNTQLKTTAGLLPGKLLGGAAIVRIIDEPQQRAATTRATVEVLFSLKDDGIKRVAGKALLYLYRTPGVASMAKGDFFP